MRFQECEGGSDQLHPDLYDHIAQLDSLKFTLVANRTFHPQTLKLTEIRRISGRIGVLKVGSSAYFVLGHCRFHGCS